MNKTLAILLITTLCVLSFRPAVSQTVQAGIFNEPAGSNVLVVRAKPSADVSGLLSGVNVSIQWQTSYNITLTIVSANYTIGLVGAGTNGANTYQTYGATPLTANINWSGASENELFRVRVDGNPGSTGTFSLTNSPGGTEWYFEVGGHDLTNSSFYQGSAGAVSLPIQLSSFTATTAVAGSSVLLKWKTLSEIDNLGFDVQRSLLAAGPFVTIDGSFQPGHGTTVDSHEYSYTDGNTEGQSWYYRLKQTDRDGSVHYSDPVQASLATGIEQEQAMPTVYALAQNYPNPFNPSTTIRYALPKSSQVTLTVYNTLGQAVTELVNGEMVAGYHEVAFKANGLASGIYFYRIKAGDFVETRKLLLLQ